MKIYTKTGDTGQTSLVGGSRISKSHIKIEAYGSVDELNSWLGMLRDAPDTDDLEDDIIDIQETLFTIGSNLALEIGSDVPIPEVSEGEVIRLEALIDVWDEPLPQMRNFVLPGGHPAVSTAHVSRTVCRRAERQVIRLSEIEEVSPIIITYLNRLSDLLFVLSRKLTFETGAKEIPWKPKKV